MLSVVSTCRLLHAVEICCIQETTGRNSQNMLDVGCQDSSCMPKFHSLQPMDIQWSTVESTDGTCRETVTFGTRPGDKRKKKRTTQKETNIIYSVLVVVGFHPQGIYSISSTKEEESGKNRLQLCNTKCTKAVDFYWKLTVEAFELDFI